MLKKSSILAAAGASAALAQSATASASAATVTIVGGTYSGQAIAGYHVGAAQSYQVALSKASSGSTASEIYFNLTSNMYMDNSIYSGGPLPCYVIKDNSIAGGTGGPLECGAATSTSYPTTGQIGNDGTVSITGVQSWWVCDVNATQPYGIINGTVVGGFSTSQPAGSGIQNCEAITGLKLGSGSSSSTSSASSASKTSTSGSASASASASASGTSSGWGWGSGWGSSSASASATSTPSMSTASSASATSTATGWGWGSSSASASSVASVTSTATGWGSTSTSASSTWAPATYTGAAVANGISGFGLMVAAGGVALMI